MEVDKWEGGGYYAGVVPRVTLGGMPDGGTAMRRSCMSRPPLSLTQHERSCARCNCLQQTCRDAMVLLLLLLLSLKRLCLLPFCNSGTARSTC